MTQTEELPILDGDGRISYLAPIVLHMHMLYPESELERQNAISVALRDGTAVALGNEKKFSSFSKLIFNKAQTRLHQGRLCGSYAIQMLRNCASLGKKFEMRAAFLVSEWASTQRDQSGRLVTSNAHNLAKTHWKIYRPVAHLWAAHEVLDRETVERAFTEVSEASERFLKVSAWFQRELLDKGIMGDCVPQTVPETFMSSVEDGSFSVSLPGLSDWESERMREYRNKNAGPPR